VARRTLLTGLLAALGATAPAAAGGLHGARPPAPLAAPAFAATNQAGQPRGPADLLGRPTVLWFYPMAGTPG